MLLRLLSYLALFFCSSLANARSFPVKNYNVEHGLSNPTVYRIFQDERGYLWFSTGYGLSRFDGNSFETEFRGDSIIAPAIMSVSRQGTNTRLISSYGGGIYIMGDSFVTKLKAGTHNMPSLTLQTVCRKDSIWMISVDTVRQLHLITGGRMSRINAKDEYSMDIRFHKLFDLNGNIIVTSNRGTYQVLGNRLRPILANSLKKMSVTDIGLDRKGQYWAAAGSKLFSVYNDIVTKQFDVGKYGVINDIMIDRFNRVWVSVAGIGVFIVSDDRIENMTVPLGLGGIIVNDIFEDAEGNIWFATQGHGVYKLISIDTRFYSTKDYPLSGNCLAISSLMDKVIIGSEGRLAIWDGQKMTEVECHSLEPMELVYNILIIKNYMYICTPYKVIRKNMRYPYTEKVLVTDKGLTGIISMHKDGNGNIWAGSFSTLYKVEGDTLTEVKNKITEGRRYFSINSDKNGNVLFGTNSGLIHLLNGVFALEKISDKSYGNNAYSMHSDKYGRCWIATPIGVVMSHQGRKRLFNVKDGLSHEFCNTLSEDSAGRLWIGTLKGLCYIDLHDSTLSIIKFRIDVYPDEILSINYVNRHTLFAGTPRGVLEVNTDRDLGNQNTIPLYITSVASPDNVFEYPSHIRVSYDYNSLTVRYNAIDFQHCGTTEYRYKLDKRDKDWRYTTNNELEFRGLPSGISTFLLSVKHRDGSWGTPVSLVIEIITPFWKKKWFIIVATVLILFAVYLLSNTINKRRQVQERSRVLSYSKMIFLKLQALTALINPHFIFNCMNSIQHFFNKKDHEAANNYLSDFASLIRMTIEDAQEAFITLEAELKRIKLYLSLEKLRFGKRMEYSVHVDDRIDIMNTKMPNMVLQPYLENAIWHGITPTLPSHTGKISLSFFWLPNNKIKILIEDNGIGISLAKKEEQHKSYGMKFTRERLNLLEKLLQTEFSVTVFPAMKDGEISGTVVEIIISSDFRREDLSDIESELD